MVGSSREPHHITNESGETSKKEPVNTGVIGYYLNGTYSCKEARP